MVNANVDIEQSIERYVLNQMDEEEATEFETFFLSNQACLEQLELTEKLYQGLKVVAASEVNNKVQPTKTDASNDWWKTGIPAWSVAAMFIVMLIPVTMNLQQHNDLSQPVGQPLVVNISLSQLRGETSQSVQTVKGDKQIILSTFVDRDVKEFDYPQYGLVIKGEQSDTTLATFTDLVVGEDGMLYMNLGNGFLKPKLYRYSIIGIDEHGHHTTLKTSLLEVIE